MKACILHLSSVVAVLVLASGCSKTEGGASGAPSATAVAVPGEAPTIAIVGTPPSASSAPAAVASASAGTPSVASAAPSAPSASASAASALVAAGSAKPVASGKPGTTTAVTSAAPAKDAPPATPLKPASTRLSGKNFTLDAASPGCRVDTPCTMTLRLAASGEYHVNKEYPYKFTATPAPGVAFLGSGDANTFSRAAGDFREDGEKAATMTVRFKPSSAGEARVTGTYKMSVCSAENCQVESQAVTLAVPVM